MLKLRHTISNFHTHGDSMKKLAAMMFSLLWILPDSRINLKASECDKELNWPLKKIISYTIGAIKFSFPSRKLDRSFNFF